MHVTPVNLSLKSLHCQVGVEWIGLARCEHGYGQNLVPPNPNQLITSESAASCTFADALCVVCITCCQWSLASSASSSSSSSSSSPSSSSSSSTSGRWLTSLNLYCLRCFHTCSSCCNLTVWVTIGHRPWPKKTTKEPEKLNAVHSPGAHVCPIMLAW